MAIKISCTECHKRISIDEAFAGGVCRCPYCKATNDVPIHSRRVSPGEPEPAAKAAPKRIPVAKRASYQGAMAAGLFILLVAMVVAVIVAVKMTGVPNGTPDPNGTNDNPFVKGPACSVAGDVTFETPVVYCVEGGGSMRSFYNDAVTMLLVSTESLSSADRCDLVVAVDDGVETFSGDGKSLVAGARGITPTGGSPMDDAFAQAVAMNPKTVVVLTRKGLIPSSTEVATEAGVKVIVVVLDGIPAVDEEMEALTQATGGAFRSYTPSQLGSFMELAELP
jgi:hypothetical protein